MKIKDPRIELGEVKRSPIKLRDYCLVGQTNCSCWIYVVVGMGFFVLLGAGRDEWIMKML